MSDIPDPLPDDIGVVLSVDPDHKGLRLDRFLALSLPEMSRSRLQQLIRDGHVCLGARTAGSGGPTEDERFDTRLCDPAYRVKPTERFSVQVPPARPAVPVAQAIPLNILFEDAHLIVLDKPAGLVVHPAPGNPDGTLVNALLAHCGDSLIGIGGVARPGIVHRLDKDTSGVMVAAKTDRAHAGLSALFAAHDIDRAYRAFVWGVPRPRGGTVNAPIGRHPTHRKKMAVVERGGKAAVTHYRTLSTFAGAILAGAPTATRDLGDDGVVSFVECRLETGRTHQIRVHMSARGSPLIGDMLYGGRRKTPKRVAAPHRTAIDSFPRQALHAYALGFEHPITGQKLDFATELPQDMRTLGTQLGFIEC